MNLNPFSFLSVSQGIRGTSDLELPEIYKLPVACGIFTDDDILATFAKILTDTLERTYGLKDKYVPLLWDNCVQSESPTGLVTLLSQAMAKREKLFLKYIPSVNVLRKATFDEQRGIEEDYRTQGKSKNGVFLSFKNYRPAEMLRIYSTLEYAVLSSLHKTLNLSTAIQFKMSKLRDTVSLADSAVPIAQAKEMARALSIGRDILLDGDDEIVTAAPDTASAEKAITFLDAKRAFILGLPLSYISGLQTTGIGTTGEADTKAVERGLKLYFFSIIQPTLLALFDEKVEFKTQDFRQMSSATELLKIFDLASDEYLSKEGKRQILRRAFELNAAEEEKNLKDEEGEREEEKQLELDALNAQAPADDGQNNPAPPRTNGGFPRGR